MFYGSKMWFPQKYLSWEQKFDSDITNDATACSPCITLSNAVGLGDDKLAPDIDR